MAYFPAEYKSRPLQSPFGLESIQHTEITSIVIFLGSFHPGDVLKGTRTLQDVYEKTGSSGPLIFVVIALNVETENGEPVLTETETRILR